jgi:hypothetical protein
MTATKMARYPTQNNHHSIRFLQMFDQAAQAFAMRYARDAIARQGRLRYTPETHTPGMLKPR